MAKIKVVSILKGNILEWDKVVLGDVNTGTQAAPKNVKLLPEGRHLCFEVSKFGTALADQVETDIGDYDTDAVLKLINSKVGVVRENNPKWEDVKTDDGGTLAANFEALTSDDTVEDDGVNDSDDRYGWCREGQLYTATLVP